VTDPGIVLLTGAAGRIGSRLIPALRARGWTVRALAHRRPVPAADQVVSGSLADAEALRRSVEGSTAVIHLAAVTHARSAAAYARVNAEGTRNLVGAAAEAGINRFVFVSSRAIDRRGGAYSGSKADAEEIVRGSGLAYTILRLPELYGLGGREGLDRLVSLVRAGSRVPIVGRGADLLCPMYVHDALAACVGGLEREAALNKTYTLAGPCLTTRGFVEEAVRAYSSSSTIIGIPPAAVSLAGRLARVLPLPLYPDQLARLKAPKPPVSGEAEVELGYCYRSLRDGLRALTTELPA
jgi:nucleoside-diphosphate-sugar epimerase